MTKLRAGQVTGVDALDSAVMVEELELVEDFNSEMDVYNTSSTDAAATLTKKILDAYTVNGVVRKIATGSGDADLKQIFATKNFKPNISGTVDIGLLMASKKADGTKLTNAEGMPTPTMLDVDSSFEFFDTYNNKQIYTHPSVAYISGGIAGYKYWMINSNITSEEYEDDELFVSNDGTNWKRVKGAYEATDADNLGFRLPPQSLVGDSDASAIKKNVLLPIPIPADNKTLEVLGSSYLINTSMKNDPFIFYDDADGYLYFYMNYHFASWENGIKNSPQNIYNITYAFEHKFIVCMRTNGTIDGSGMVWEIVRADGSTFRLTEATSLRLFTSDEGVNNFIRHQDLTPTDTGGGVYANPDSELSQSVIKTGVGSYFFYFTSGSFLKRRAGTTPYTFDWVTASTTCSTDGHKGHHPDVRFYNSKYYVLGGGKLHESNDGITFTMFPKRIGWAGSPNGRLYKEAFVVNADDAEVLYVSARKGYVATGRPGMQTQYQHSDKKLFDKTFIQKFSKTLAEMLTLATNGHDEGNIDVQVVIADSEANDIPVTIYEKFGLKPDSYIGSFGAINCFSGIELTGNEYVRIVVTMNCRNGGIVEFGGITIG